MSNLQVKDQMTGQVHTLMKLVIAVTCFSFLNTSLRSQQVPVVSGYILDAETAEPVSYASVGVPQQGIGVSANINGYFSLQVNETNPGHFLEISSLGYARKRIPFSSINWGQDLQIALEPRVTTLSEVVIAAKRQTLEDVVTAASKKRKIFMRSTPYLTHAFYRETLQIDQQYRGITEAQGIFFINGYQRQYQNNQNQVMTYDLAQWKHLRRSHYPSESYLRIGKMLKAKDYYLHDGPLKRRNLTKFKYTVVDSSQYNDQLVLVVEFEPLEAYAGEITYKGRMMIKEDDQALLSLQVEQQGTEPYLPSRKALKNQTSSFSISFLQFEGQYFLNRSSFTQVFTQDGRQHKYVLEIIGGPFAQQKAPFMNTAQRAVLYSDMLNPKVNYDPGFWDAYGFSESGVFKEVSEDMGDLRPQFEDNHDLRLVPLPEGIKNYQQMVDEQNLLDFFMQY